VLTRLLVAVEELSSFVTTGGARGWAIMIENVSDVGTLLLVLGLALSGRAILVTQHSQAVSNARHSLRDSVTFRFDYDRVLLGLLGLLFVFLTGLLHMRAPPSLPCLVPLMTIVVLSLLYSAAAGVLTAMLWTGLDALRSNRSTRGR
jgi:hypothetical protein